jgi:hypothetical protein
VTVVSGNYALMTVSLSAPSSQTIRFSPGGTIVLHSRETVSRRVRLVDAATGLPYGGNAMSQGVFPLTPGTTPLNNIAAGTYRLEILDNADRVTKTVTIAVIEGQTKDYEV